MPPRSAPTPDEYIAALSADRRDPPLNTVYADLRTEAWIRERFAAAGKRLDMGRSCVRFRRLGDLPLEVIGQTIARVDVERLLQRYAEARGSSRTRAAASRGA